MRAEVDFQGSFTALEPLEYFHAEVLKAFVRGLQLRTAECQAHIDRAWTVYERDRALPRVVEYAFLARMYTFDLAMIEESRDPLNTERIAATEKAIMEVLESAEPALPAFDQSRLLAGGFYKLIRGDYDLALEAFRGLIEESSQRLEPTQATYHMGAAAAAFELGQKKEAEKHYQNASLCASTHSNAFWSALTSSRLYALTTHWGRMNPAGEWLSTLNALSIPQASKDAFLERANLMLSATEARGKLFIAG